MDSDFVRFEPQIYHFFLGSGADAQDITHLIRRADKEAMIPGFDVEFDNERLYVEKYVREHGKLPPDVGTNSIWGAWWDLIRRDPLGAGIEMVGDATKSVGNWSTMILLGLAAWWFYHRTK